MTALISSHGAHALLTTADDRVLIGGRPVAELIARVGRTPCYAYDQELVRQRIRDVRAALPAQIRLHYAVKANPMPALVQLIAGLVDGLDVASAAEMYVALNGGMSPGRISIAGPGKSEDELARAITAGIVVNVESPRELEVIARLGPQLGKRPQIAVRVNPDFELKTSGMKMGGGPKQFGIDAERVPEVLREMARMPVEFLGFHIFWGSQNLQAEAICEAQRKTLALAVELARHAPAAVRKLNIGGGFGIPYFPGERPLDLRPVAENLATLTRDAQRLLPEAELIVELGRYLVGEAGIYVCEVIVRKESRGQVFLVTNGGLHHHLAASGNFGQVIRKNYPVVVAHRVAGGPREVASVVGPLCTPLDLLADRMDLARADVGDLIVVLQSGAYGLTASPSAFLSHPPAAEVLV